MLKRSCSSLSLVLLALAGAGCADDIIPPGPPPPASFSVRGSVEQIQLWKAPPGAHATLRDVNGATVQEGTTDAQGSLIFRRVPPGEGYAITVDEADAPNVASSIAVMTVEGSSPPQDFYSKQTLSPGFNYITTRDGTKLSAYVTLPGPIEDGPYPTVINYSGYSPSAPGAPLGDYAFLCPSFPVLCDAPNDASALIAALNGYATVGVNIRGTGCSGGAYEYFETLQLLDGYDIIEAVAAQPWVKGNRVGMTGLSYPGISQLFVAQTRPPSLAAITPFSVIGGTYSTGRPGGIFNDGFALEWITAVLSKAAPYAQGWEQGMVDGGDTTCEENQLLHSQLVDSVEELKNTPYYADDRAGVLDPTAFAPSIEVPVFLAAAFQDEQTGPFFFTLLNRFTSSPLTRFTVYNGVHPDAFAPQVLVEWKAFLDIYVAQVVPKISADVRTFGPVLFQNVFGAKLDIPPDRFAQYATWEEAKAAYEAEGSLRVIFEDGASDTIGAPEGTSELRFDAWPPPETSPLRLYFQPDGSLDKAPPIADAASSFMLDPGAGQRGILAPNADVWALLPNYVWNAPAAGNAVVLESPPLAEDLVLVGSASVDVWIRSPVDDADLEATLIEVRPDGQEMYIQSGWLRASVRKLAASATELWPDHTYQEKDVAPLVPGEWTEARVGIPAFAHVLRAGSSLRLEIDTPGDTRARWMFALKTFSGPVAYDIGHGAAHPSSVVLPVIAGKQATTPLPPCPSLRAQPCRAHAAFANTPSGM